MNVVELLQANSYFSGIAKEKLETYHSEDRILHLKCGETLIRQGDKGGNAFVLLDGRLRSHIQKGEEEEIHIGEVGPGEIVGELAVLLDRERGATVTALRDSILLKLDRNDLNQLVQSQENSLASFTETIIQRSQPRFAFQQKIHSVLVFPLHELSSLSQFTGQLTRSLKRFLSTEQVDLAHHQNTSSKGELASLFANAESTHPMVVYLSQGQMDLPTQVAASRVDRIVLLAESGAPLPVQAQEKQLREHLRRTNHAHVELVLLHPNRDTPPRQTQQWLQDRPVLRHHHLVRGDTADTDKLSRFLTGNAVGLALSGGGFKASMQVGIMHALREGGIPFDILGGSSGGAFAGAGLARAPQSEEIVPILREFMDLFQKAGKLTLPFISLFTGKYFSRGFREMLGNQDMADLWLNFFCLSLNLVNGEIVVHQEGPLWESVRASSSVMGLFPPLIRGEECLVDGGFINPCPTDILHQMGAGKIMVISTFGQAGVELKDYFPPDISGWSVFWRKLNPFKKEKYSPSLTSSIVNSMLLASTHLLEGIFSKSKIDLFIQPDVSEYTAQDLSKFMELYEMGYNYGREHIDTWKSQLNLPDPS